MEESEQQLNTYSKRDSKTLLNPENRGNVKVKNRVKYFLPFKRKVF